MPELEIATDDPNFLADLKAANIPGLEVSQIMREYAAIDFAAVAEHAQKFVISAERVIVISFFLSWLYNRLAEFIVKSNPYKTTIDGRNVTNNIEYITTMIQNNIQITINEKPDEQKEPQ